MTRVKLLLSNSAAKRSQKLVTTMQPSRLSFLRTQSSTAGAGHQRFGATAYRPLYACSSLRDLSRVPDPCSEPLWLRHQTSVSGSPRRLPVAWPGRARPAGSRSRKGLRWQPVNRTLGVVRWGAADPRQRVVAFVFRPGRATGCISARSRVDSLSFPPLGLHVLPGIPVIRALRVGVGRRGFHSRLRHWLALWPWLHPSFRGLPLPYLAIVSSLMAGTMGLPVDSAGKESACNAGNPGLIPGLGRSSGEGIGYPIQYSGLESSMDCIVHGVAKSRKRLSDFH